MIGLAPASPQAVIFRCSGAEEGQVHAPPRCFEKEDRREYDVETPYGKKMPLRDERHHSASVYASQPAVAVNWLIAAFDGETLHLVPNEPDVM